jgi:hypothetical protein
MKIGRQWILGPVMALVLLSVPATAVHRALGQAGTSATQMIIHQNSERVRFNQFARQIRAQFRRSGIFLRRSAERYLRDLLLDLRAHWRAERRGGVTSPFDFPDL